MADLVIYNEDPIYDNKKRGGRRQQTFKYKTLSLLDLMVYNKIILMVK